jgi:phage regulator Rha-like protein
MNELMTNKQTMSSRAIAELVESRHDKVKQSIERLVERGVISKPPMGDGAKSANGVVEKVYLIGKRDSYVIVAQLSPEFTARLVDRWQELEEKEQQRLIQEQPQPNPALESDKYIEASKVMKAAKIALGGFIKDKNQLVISCSQVAYQACGVDIVKAAGLQLIAQEQKQLLNVTEVGKQLTPKYTPREVNLLLAENSYQEKAQDDKGRNYWLITSKGEEYGLYQDTGKQHSSGAPVRQFKWYSSIINELQIIIEELAA